MATSVFLGNAILNHFFRNAAQTPPTTIRVSLHTAAPGATGANEVIGGGYGRRPVSFNAAASGSINNAAAFEYANMPATTITHVGTWDADAAGNYFRGGALTAPRTLAAGDTVRVSAGALTITEA